MAGRVAKLVVALSAALAVIWVAAPAETIAEERRPFTPPVLAPPGGPIPGQVRDRVLASGHDGRMLRRLARAANTYTDAHGHHVDVEVSEGYAPDPAADQALVDFLGSLLHGEELNALSVYVATPEEIPAICGAMAAACYFHDIETMVIVGEESFGGLPTSYVATHEYGHHVENHRRNTPWSSLFWGTKRWSTGERICPRYLAGEIYPGDRFGEYPGNEVDFYWQNPGEAFAEAYAKYHPQFRNVPWEWDASLEPDQDAYRRIYQDVTNPWLRNETVRYKARLAKRKRVSKKFATPLDGKVVVKLRGPKRSNFDLYVKDAAGSLVGRSTGRKSREKVVTVACGDAKLRFIVRAFKGKGRIVVTVKKP